MPMEIKDQHLPFYSMIENIEANWFGEGSDELESYDPYYMGLLISNNPKSQKLYQFVKSQESNSSKLLYKFEIGDKDDR